jgi:hypothetical protein
VPRPHWGSFQQFLAVVHRPAKTSQFEPTDLLERSVGQRLPAPIATSRLRYHPLLTTQALSQDGTSAICSCPVSPRSRESPLQTPATLRYTRTPRRPRKHHSNNVFRPQVRYAATEIESAKSARARGSYLRVSFKNTRETAQAINGWKVTRALQYLENVKGHAEAVPMRRYAGSTGRTAQGT